MKAELDRSNTSNVIFQISFWAVALSASLFFAFIEALLLSDEEKFVIIEVILAITTLLFAAVCVIIAGGCRVSITADNEKIIVAHTIFGKKFSQKNIMYDKIECAEFEVKAIGTRLYGVIYKMFFTVQMKNGSEMSGFKKLSIESEFPVSRPDEYKRYISEQPLAKLCDFINEQIQTRV